MYFYAFTLHSADSRQVYKGLDLGSGKDLSEYFVNGRQIPYHLIDIATLESEYNVFCFQQDFYRIFNSLKAQGKFAFVAGGTTQFTFFSCIKLNHPAHGAFKIFALRIAKKNWMVRSRSKFFQNLNTFMAIHR